MKVSRYPLEDLPQNEVVPLLGDSFFGSPGFAQLWTTRGGKPVYWTVEHDGDLLAVLPGVEFGVKPVRRYYAMPDGCYARIFHNPDIPVERETTARILLEALAANGYVKLFLYDFYRSLVPDERFGVQPRSTTLVDISSPDWQPPDDKLRSQIRKATREGIQVTTFDWARHHRSFLDLMKLTEKRHGQVPRHSPEFFRALAELACEDNRVRWVWCEHDSHPVSSHIYVIEHTMLLGWQMYFDKAFSFLKPNQYIRFMMCRQMARQGITKLNLGATPPGAESLAYYKRRWGGTTRHYQCYVLKRGLGKYL